MDSSEDGQSRIEPSVAVPRMWQRRDIRVFYATALVVIIVDQITKYLAQEYLLPRRLNGEPAIEVLGSFLKLTYAENTGAAFSLGTGITWVFTIIGFVVVGFILRYSRKLGSVWWALALGGALGGAIGNLIDRMFRAPGPFRGFVVDFLQLPYWPVFNVADSAVVVSGIGIVILLVRGIAVDGSRVSTTS